MDLVARAKNIILNPVKEWEVIKTESISTGEMFTKYAMILAAIPAVALFIGYSFVGQPSLMGVHVRTPLANGLSFAVLLYLLSLGGVYLLAYVIDVLATNFGAQKDMNASMKVAVFSMTALWLAGIFTILPPLSILLLVGLLYSLYLLYVGMKSLKGVPADKLVGYYVVTLIIATLICVVVFFAAATIAGTPAVS